MSDQNLQFNIIPFNWPEDEVSFYFNKQEQAHCYRLHRRYFPKKLERIFPGIKGTEAKFVTTSFDRPVEGFVPLDIDLRHDHAELARLYFLYKVYTHFKGQENVVVGNGFARGVQVWVPAYKAHCADYLSFECFRLDVRIGSAGSTPELVTRYEREVKVCRKSVAQMIEHVPPISFQWLLAGKRLLRYEEHVQDEDVDVGSALPVMNGEIRKVLGMALFSGSCSLCLYALIYTAI